MIVADTSGLLALYNRTEPAHAAVARAVMATTDVIVVSPYVVAEIDHLMATRLGIDAELAMLRELAGGAYEHPHLADDELTSCAEIIARYQDQQIGVTDASLVVLAHRYATNRILTLDRRHFDVLRPIDGGHFEIVPG